MTQKTEFQDKVVLYIHPQYLDASINEHVRSLLESMLEKKWSEAHGFITDVKMLPLKSAGRINAKTGFTEITVYYKANSCKPTIGETMTAQIQRTTKLGMHLKCGPFKLFMHEKMLPSSFSYTEDAFKCAKTGRILQAGVEVVVEIVGTSWTDGEYMIIVTLV